MANTKVTGDVIANGTISTVHLADDAITAAKLDSTATGITFADLTVDTNTLYVDAANNRVGIGTDLPNEKLTVNGNIESLDTFILKNSGGHKYQQLFQSTNDFVIRYNNSSSWFERMRITSSGNISIDRTTNYVGGAPSGTDGRFNVYTDVGSSTWAQQIRHDSTAGNGLFIRAGASSSYYTAYFAGYDESNVHFVVRGDGNVGIGANSPQYNLHVVDTSNTSYVGISNQGTTNADRQLRLGFGNGHTYATIQGTRLNVADDVDIVLQGGGGNVGIGGSPSYKLDVQDSANDSLTLARFLNTSTGSNTLKRAKIVLGNTDTVGTKKDVVHLSTFINEENAVGGGLIIATRGSDSVTEKMRVDSSGNVGINEDNPASGTSTNSRTLHISHSNVASVSLDNTNQNAKFDLASIDVSGGALGIFKNTSSGTSASASLLRITSAGELLVNQTTPNTTGDGFGVHPTGSSGGNLVACHNGTSGTALIVGHGAYDGTIVDFRRGSFQVGTISVTSSATAYNTSGSDERLKKNITDWNENILDKFKDIQPKEFHFNEQEDTEEKQKGYIAQNEVDKFPKAYPLVYNEELKEDRHMFNPSGMTVYLMKAIQELKADNDSLRARIETLENN